MENSSKKILAISTLDNRETDKKSVNLEKAGLIRGQKEIQKQDFQQVIRISLSLSLSLSPFLLSPLSLVWVLKCPQYEMEKVGVGWLSLHDDTCLDSKVMR